MLARGQLAVASDPRIDIALAADAVVAFSVSGGKDSAAATIAANNYLDSIGHDRSRRFIIHADLGRIEWGSTPSQIDLLAKSTNLPLITVRRRAGDLIGRWQQRFENGKARYVAITTYNLIGPFSSSALRFCTSEMKTHVIQAELRRRFPGETIVSVIGLRRDESRSRATTPISRPNGTTLSRKAGTATQLINWHPIAAWSVADVYDFHKANDVALHEAYVRWNATRMGCSFCVLASLRNLETSAAAPGNRASFKLVTELEISSAFSFQPGRWLADVAPHLLDGEQICALAQSKLAATRRRALEAGLPGGLRFKRGWPPRIPTMAEARVIAATRAEILDTHALPNIYPTAADVVARFADLHSTRTGMPDGRVRRPT